MLYQSVSTINCGFDTTQRVKLQLVPGVRGQQVKQRQIQICVKASQNFSPPTVSDTKQIYMKSYSKPVPYIYSNVLQEILVQGHFMVYNNNYKYNEVFALGIFTLFKQVFEGYDKQEADAIFESFIKALNLDPQQLKQDSMKIEEWGKQQSSYEALLPSESSDGSSQFNSVAPKFASGEPPYYSRFLAIGTFRLLELTKAKDPKALEILSNAYKINQGAITRDLKIYRTVLQKLRAAKELFKEVIARERRKQAEREEKKNPTAKEKEAPTGQSSNGAIEQKQEEKVKA